MERPNGGMFISDMQMHSHFHQDQYAPQVVSYLSSPSSPQVQYLGRQVALPSPAQNSVSVDYQSQGSLEMGYTWF